MPSHVRVIPTIVIVIVVLVAAWGNSYQSCLRSEHVRASLRISYQATETRARKRATTEHGLERQLDLQAKASSKASLARVSHLVCLAPLPPT